MESWVRLYSVEREHSNVAWSDVSMGGRQQTFDIKINWNQRPGLHTTLSLLDRAYRDEY